MLSRVKTGVRDHFPISQMRLVKYENGIYNEFGPLIKGR